MFREMCTTRAVATFRADRRGTPFERVEGDHLIAVRGRAAQLFHQPMILGDDYESAIHEQIVSTKMS